MKSTVLYRLLLFSAISSLCGCGSDELTDGSSPSGVVETFSITVADRGGYVSASGGAHTRATEDGYTTTFTAGDRVGVFAVKEGQIMLEVNNLCLTAQADAGGALVWKDNGNDLLRFTGATYYAYYPYQPTLTGDPVPNAPDANTFFANIISNWTPATNQGTYSDYTAQDLMIAQGSEADKVLSFAMEHCMALVVIDLPQTQYTFDNTNPSIPDYIIDAPGTHFNSFTPHRMSDCTYRYLVKPAGSTASLSGGYTNADAKEVEWAIDASAITSGEYKVFTVDGAGVVPKSHTLQVGDYYLNDGSLVGKDETLTPEQEAACIGIVFWVGDATQKDNTLRADHPACTHGLVVALKDAADGTTVWQNPFSSVQSWLNGNQNGKYLSVASGTGSTEPLNNIQGYNNTKAIEKFNDDAANSGNLVQAVVKVTEYRNNVSVPANSSGWYLPSEKELTLLCGTDADDIWSNNSGGTANRDLINGKLNSISSVATTILSAGYWSSTESSYYSDNAFYVNFGNGVVNSNFKYYTYRARCVLAF